MKFNYNGRWKVLIDKNMKKKDLIDRTGISSITISKMVRGEADSLQIEDEHNTSGLFADGYKIIGFPFFNQKNRMSEFEEVVDTWIERI